MLPSPLDCESLAPFDVFRIPFQFDGDPESIPKLFVVALNVSSVGLIRCFKPTSQEQNFLGDEFVLKGVVHYLKGEVDFFHADHTFISPEVYAIPYSQLRLHQINRNFEFVGRLPEDFRQRIEAAARNKSEWNRRNKLEFFKWFGGML